jgi:hypothetical protein
MWQKKTPRNNNSPALTCNKRAPNNTVTGGGGDQQRWGPQCQTHQAACQQE